MGLFGFGKSDKEKEREEQERHEATRRRMLEAKRQQDQAVKANQGRPATPATGGAVGARPGADGHARPVGSPGVTVGGGQRPAATAGGAGTYTVQSGDSLSRIAKRELGDANRWREIYELNREVIGGNPDLIHPGQRLRLPGPSGSGSSSSLA